MVPVRTLRFAKDDHHLIFRYTPRRGDEIIDYIMNLAKDKDCSLDWLDAATLSFQVANYAAAGDEDILITSSNPHYPPDYH